MSGLSDEDLDRATRAAETSSETDTKTDEGAEKASPPSETRIPTAPYGAQPRQAIEAVSPEVTDEKPTSEEVRQQFTTLIGYADGLPEDDTDEEEPRDVAQQLDALLASGTLSDEQRDEARQAASDLRLHTDEIKLRRLTGLNITFSDTDSLMALANGYSSEECQQIIEALRDDLDLEVIPREQVQQFKTAVLKRHHVLLDMAAQAPREQKPEEEKPSQRRKPRKKSDLPTEAGGRVIPLTREGSLAPTLEAPASEPPPAAPNEAPPHPPQERVGAVLKLRRLWRSIWARMRFLLKNVSTILILFIIIFLAGNMLMPYLRQTAPHETPDAPVTVHVPDAPSLPATEPPPDGVGLPTQPEVSATPVFPLPQPVVALPALNCLPYTETDRCAATASDATVSEEMMATCADRQAHPSFSQEEHTSFWDCGGAWLDLDATGRQNVCQPSCCFCRYQ